MLGQFFEWLVLDDGVVVVELLDEELVDGVVVVGVVDVEPPLAALAMAAPPPATAPARDKATRAVRSRIRMIGHPLS
jgi:hypothetical protein